MSWYTQQIIAMSSGYLSRLLYSKVKSQPGAFKGFLSLSLKPMQHIYSCGARRWTMLVPHTASRFPAWKFRPVFCSITNHLNKLNFIKKLHSTFCFLWLLHWAWNTLSLTYLLHYLVHVLTDFLPNFFLHSSCNDTRKDSLLQCSIIPSTPSCWQKTRIR